MMIRVITANWSLSTLHLEEAGSGSGLSGTFSSVFGEMEVLNEGILNQLLDVGFTDVLILTFPSTKSVLNLLLLLGLNFFDEVGQAEGVEGVDSPSSRLAYCLLAPLVI